ncbi:hypothetical protein C8Q79DRAFT_926209 [Trametes meyenii]|nr:hypothetical protein C8Q79DRAFT_926209 [Trametes meyenii]
MSSPLPLSQQPPLLTQPKTWKRQPPQTQIPQDKRAGKGGNTRRASWMGRQSEKHVTEKQTQRGISAEITDGEDGGLVSKEAHSDRERAPNSSDGSYDPNENTPTPAEKKRNLSKRREQLNQPPMDLGSDGGDMDAEGITDTSSPSRNREQAINSEILEYVNAVEARGTSPPLPMGEDITDPKVAEYFDAARAQAEESYSRKRQRTGSLAHEEESSRHAASPVPYPQQVPQVQHQFNFHCPSQRAETATNGSHTLRSNPANVPAIEKTKAQKLLDSTEAILTLCQAVEWKYAETVSTLMREHGVTKEAADALIGATSRAGGNLVANLPMTANLPRALLNENEDRVDLPEPNQTYLHPNGPPLRTVPPPHLRAPVTPAAAMAAVDPRRRSAVAGQDDAMDVDMTTQPSNTMAWGSSQRARTDTAPKAQRASVKLRAPTPRGPMRAHESNAVPDHGDDRANRGTTRDLRGESANREGMRERERDYEAALEYLKAYPHPAEELPAIEQGASRDRLRNMAENTVREWAKGAPPERRCIVEAYGHDHLEGRELGITASRMENFMGTYLGSTEYELVAPSETPTGVSKTEAATAWLLTADDEAAVSTLVKRKIIQLETITLIVHPAELPIPRFVVALDGFILENPKMVAKAVREELLEEAMRKSIEDLVAKNPKYEKWSTRRAVMEIIDSVSIELWRDGKGEGAPLVACVYIDPPTQNGESWDRWRDGIRAHAFANANGRTITPHPWMRCEGCHGVDHTYRTCKLRALGGWKATRLRGGEESDSRKPKEPPTAPRSHAPGGADQQRGGGSRRNDRSYNDSGGRLVYQDPAQGSSRSKHNDYYVNDGDFAHYAPTNDRPPKYRKKHYKFKAYAPYDDEQDAHHYGR